MNFLDFIKKKKLPVKLSNITAISNISFATILTNIFCKTDIFFVLILYVNLDKKNLQNGITEGKIYKGKKYHS